MAEPDPIPTTAYLEVDDATALAAANIIASRRAAWDAADEDDQAAALLQASVEIDSLRYAGIAYDDYAAGVLGTQERAFPRVVLDDAADWPAGKTLASARYYDWPEDEDAPVVPARVKLACLWQAIMILGNRINRLRDQHDGVAGQSAAGISETYRDTPPNLVCLEASRLLEPYRLKGGRAI